MLFYFKPCTVSINIGRVIFWFQKSGGIKSVKLAPSWAVHSEITYKALHLRSNTENDCFAYTNMLLPQCTPEWPGNLQLSKRTFCLKTLWYHPRLIQQLIMKLFHLTPQQLRGLFAMLSAALTRGAVFSVIPYEWSSSSSLHANMTIIV